MATAGAIAGKAGAKLGDYAPLIIAAVLVGAAIYVYSTSSGGSGYQIVGATNNSAERTAADTAYATAVTAHEQSVMAGFNALVGEATTQYNDTTQVTLGAQQLQSSIAQYQTQSAIAALEEQASAAQSAAALSAAQAQAHAAQQASVWGAFGKLFADIPSFFGVPSGGSSVPSMANASFGSFG